MRRAVLFINTPTYVGGAEISLLALMQHLEPDQFVPHLLTTGDGPLLARTRAAGIPSLVHEFPWFSKRRPWRYGSCIGGLVRLVHRQHIKLVHTNCDHSLRYAMWTNRLTRIPYVSHVRDFTRTWFEPGKVAALNRAARVIANSRMTTRVCLEAGVRPERLVTIYNPIDLAAFGGLDDATRVRERRALGIPISAVVIGLLGQVQAIKGHAEFMQAAIQVAERVPDVHFVLVGATPPGEAAQRFAESVQRQARESVFPDRFHFTGFRPDVPAVMAALDLVAVPSWNEPFGRVAVEAMAAGRAVVGTNAGGLPEIITDNVDGLLVAPRDPRALAEALVRLAQDASLRARLARAGERSAARFSVERHVRAVQAVYLAVLTEVRRAA
jgi:glycosyltransferase involved in cell wall biosynthesis